MDPFGIVFGDSSWSLLGASGALFGASWAALGPFLSLGTSSAPWGPPGPQGAPRRAQRDFSVLGVPGTTLGGTRYHLGVISGKKSLALETKIVFDFHGNVREGVRF